MLKSKQRNSHTEIADQEASMCRSIKTLRRGAEAASLEEIEAAALQFVRKVSGYRQPSRRNEDAFGTAVREITASSQRLLDSLALAAERSPAP